MNKKKKNYNWFFKTLGVLFIMFLCLYSISVNGYVQRGNQNRTLYTEEQIKQFEADVANGREVDINEYLSQENQDYSNASSEFGEKVSDAIDYSANKSIEVLNSFFSFLFE